MNTPTTLDNLDEVGSQREEFLRLRDAKLVLVDYPQVLADFPRLGEGRTEVEAQEAVDRWLLDNAAVVSKGQAFQSIVNSPIRIRDHQPAPGIRPPRHGRSAVISALCPADGQQARSLLSIKGVGVSDRTAPALQRQKNGLIPLYCALYEFLMHKLVLAAFRHAGSVHRVLPAYAVIDTGFDELELESGIPRPAGLLVRRAHFRPKGGVDLPRMGSVQQRAAAEAEFVLRHYGLTSNPTSPWLRLERTTSDYQLHVGGMLECAYSQEKLRKLHAMIGQELPIELDGISLQFTEDVDEVRGGLELVDLHYAVRSRFELPLVSTVCNRPFAWGGRIDPDHPDFVQPREDLLCDPAVWVKRPPTDEEVERLPLADRELRDGGTLLCMDAAVRSRHGGKESAEALLEVVARTIGRWPRPTTAPAGP